MRLRARRRTTPNARVGRAATTGLARDATSVASCLHNRPLGKVPARAAVAERSEAHKVDLTRSALAYRSSRGNRDVAPRVYGPPAHWADPCIRFHSFTIRRI